MDTGYFSYISIHVSSKSAIRCSISRSVAWPFMYGFIGHVHRNTASSEDRVWLSAGGPELGPALKPAKRLCDCAVIKKGGTSAIRCLLTAHTATLQGPVQGPAPGPGCVRSGVWRPAPTFQQTILIRPRGSSSCHPGCCHGNGRGCHPATI